MLSAFIPSGRSYPAVPLAGQPVHRWSVHSGPLVLGAASLMYLTPAMDMDRTVSRRSEPSSRTTLMGEQPNPWDLLQPQDVMSRHRGAKPPRRYGLLGEISLGSLSPTFVPARPVSLAVKLPSAFMLFARFLSALREPLDASVALSEATAPVKLPAWYCPEYC